MLSYKNRMAFERGLLSVVSRFSRSKSFYNKITGMNIYGIITLLSYVFFFLGAQFKPVSKLTGRYSLPGLETGYETAS